MPRSRYSPGNITRCPSTPLLRRLRLAERNVPLHLHVVLNGIELGVVAHAVVLAVDHELPAEASRAALVEHHRGGDRDALGGAAYGQVTSDVELVRPGRLHAHRLEGDRGVLLHIEKVGAAQMPIAALLTGIDAGGINGDGHRGVLPLGRVELHVGIPPPEEAMRAEHARVGHEIDLRVRLVDRVRLGVDEGAGGEDKGQREGRGQLADSEHEQAPMVARCGVSPCGPQGAAAPGIHVLASVG